MDDKEFQKKLDDAISSNEILAKNKKFLIDLIGYISKPINTESPSFLRVEIAEAFQYMGTLIRIKSRAESIYRVMQKEAAIRSTLAGSGRDAEIAGVTAAYRYARDVLDGYFETLKARLSAAKAILASLDSESRVVLYDR